MNPALSTSIKQGARQNTEDTTVSILFGPVAGLLGVLLLVADGVGGSRFGQVASQMAAFFFSAGFRRHLLINAGGPALADDTIIEALTAGAHEAQASLQAAAEQDDRLVDSATTLVAAAIIGPRVYVLWIGDSRAYLWREGRSRLLTRDHSFVRDLVQEGELSAEDADRHPHANRITRCLSGSGRHFEIDLRAAELQPDDVVYLCSDGLVAGLSEPEISRAIAEALAGRRAFSRLADELASEAIQAGSRDNVSVTLARCEHVPSDPLSPLTLTGSYLHELPTVLNGS